MSIAITLFPPLYLCDMIPGELVTTQHNILTIKEKTDTLGANTVTSLNIHRE